MKHHNQGHHALMLRSSNDECLLSNKDPAASQSWPLSFFSSLRNLKSDHFLVKVEHFWRQKLSRDVFPAKRGSSESVRARVLFVTTRHISYKDFNWKTIALSFQIKINCCSKFVAAAFLPLPS